jgi:hypothetical protein
MSAFESTLHIRPAEDLVFLASLSRAATHKRPLCLNSPFVISDNDDFCLGGYFVFGSSRQRPFFPPWPPTLKKPPRPRTAHAAIQHGSTAVRRIASCFLFRTGPELGPGLCLAPAHKRTMSCSSIHIHTVSSCTVHCAHTPHPRRYISFPVSGGVTCCCCCICNQA